MSGRGPSATLLRSIASRAYVMSVALGACLATRPGKARVRRAEPSTFRALLFRNNLFDRITEVFVRPWLLSLLMALGWLTAAIPASAQERT